MASHLWNCRMDMNLFEDGCKLAKARGFNGLAAMFKHWLHNEIEQARQDDRRRLPRDRQLEGPQTETYLPPTIREDLGPTFHRDSTVSYWSKAEERWRRQHALAIHSDERRRFKERHRERLRKIRQSLRE